MLLLLSEYCALLEVHCVNVNFTLTVLSYVLVTIATAVLANHRQTTISLTFPGFSGEWLARV